MESSNTYDSVVVKNFSDGEYMIGPTHPGQGAQGYVAYVNLDYSSSYRGDYYSEDIFSNSISRSFLRGGFVFYSGSVGDSISNIKVEAILDTLLIENTVYKNVMAMKIQKDDYILEDCRFFYVDSLGIVKKEILIGDSVVITWNLLRCKTILYNVTDK